MKAGGWKSCVAPYVTDGVLKLLEKVDDRMPVEELRIRAGQPIQLIFSGGERILRREGGAAAVTREDCAEILQKICAQSLYAWERELKRGFVTLPGGCRVGLSGSMSATDGGFLSGDVSGFNFRIAQAVAGAADTALSYLVEKGRLRAALIISPPGYGKTTMLRDIARQASMGLGGIRACRVGVVDTRYEIAGSVGGLMQLDLGPRTDVLSGLPKGEGMRMMITNMAPDVIITDELSSPEEADAALEAHSCGVTVIASAHAADAYTLMARPSMRRLLREEVFERYLLLSKDHGRLAAAYDTALSNLPAQERTCSAS